MNQLQNSLNSGLGSLADNRNIRDLSGASNGKIVGKQNSENPTSVTPKQTEDSNGGGSPPRINIIKQKVNLNKINVNGNIVNHS